MGKLANKIIILIFLSFIFIFSILNILTVDKTFSESENRVLSKSPQFTIENILSGKFTNKFELYISDQFVFKDFWVALKSDVERLSLKKENNGVFFGKDSYLLEDFKNSDERINRNIDIINQFIDKVPDVSTNLILVPNSVKVYEDKLPLFVDVYDQLKILTNVKGRLDGRINFIDVYETLNSKKNEYIYFKTDHHWTMRGAYYGYAEFCNATGITPYKLDDFNVKVVSEDFYGTFYSKANNSHIPSDKIELFTSKFDNEYEIKYSDKESSSDSLYEFKYLNKRDQYSMFLDGNHPLLTIESNVNNSKKIVVFKDSYANVFIPFLANHYKEIHVIDLRYYKLNVSEYIKENEINEALFLYNVSTFSNDTSLSWLVR